MKESSKVKCGLHIQPWLRFNQSPIESFVYAYQGLCSCLWVMRQALIEFSLQFLVCQQFEQGKITLFDLFVDDSQVGLQGLFL